MVKNFQVVCTSLKTMTTTINEGVKFHSRLVENAGTKKDHATAHKTIMKRQTHFTGLHQPIEFKDNQVSKKLCLTVLRYGLALIRKPFAKV